MDISAIFKDWELPTDRYRTVDLYDFPGIGDSDVNVATLIHQLSYGMQAGDRPFVFDAVVMCDSILESRARLDLQLACKLIDIAFDGQSKWDAVVYACTKVDSAKAVGLTDPDKRMK